MTDKTSPTHLRVENLANKLQMLWGNSPDVELLRDVAQLLKPTEPEVVQETPKVTPKKTKAKKA